jgi:hypothetical protein
VSPVGSITVMCSNDSHTHRLIHKINIYSGFPGTEYIDQFQEILHKKYLNFKSLKRSDITFSGTVHNDTGRITSTFALEMGLPAAL